MYLKEIPCINKVTIKQNDQGDWDNQHDWDNQGDYGDWNDQDYKDDWMAWMTGMIWTTKDDQSS